MPFRFPAGSRTGRNGLGQVAPLLGDRADPRIDLHPQRAAGQLLDLASLALGAPGSGHHGG